MAFMVGEDVLDAAFERARSVGAGDGLTVRGLNAPLDAQMTNWIGPLWDTAESAIRLAWEHGRAAATSLIEQFHTQLQELSTVAGNAASAVCRAITERLNEFFQGLVEGALARVQPTIKVAGREIAIRGVTIEQTLHMSGSLKASLEEICEFVAEGEISVSAEYGAG